RDARVARFAAAIRPIDPWPAVSLATGTATRKRARATCVLLARRRCRVGDMACASGVYPRNAIGSVACGRARILHRSRLSVLVAGCSTVAKWSETPRMVDCLIPLSRDVAV